MTDFKVEYDNRFYTMFLEDSQVSPETVEVKVIMYNTVYNIYKDLSTNTWKNHISKFELGEGLLNAIGKTLEGHLNI